MTEKDNSHQHDESLVQQHALKRLDKVEEEKQKTYKKKKEPINFRSVFISERYVKPTLSRFQSSK